MALARIKTWIAGELLKAADLNGEFNNILNNAISLISPTTGAINFNLQAHTGLLPNAITATSGTLGQALVVSSSGGVQFGAAAGQAGSRVMGLSGTLSSQTGTFAANQYVMQTTDAKSSWVVSASSAFSASVGTAGPAAGGRDVAGVFASTNVHWYAITTGPLSTAPAAIVSSQPPPTGPVMPSGYTGWTYLGGSVYTSASTTVAQNHRFLGHTAYLDGVTPVLTAGAATAETAVSLTTAVPSNASAYQLDAFLNVVSSVGATFFDVTPAIRVVSGSNYITQQMTAASASTFTLNHHFKTAELPNVANQFFYLLTIVTGTSANLTARVVSYDMPNGG